MSQHRRLTGTAKRLRHEMTDAERVLWREIRAHRFHGVKFRRQEPMGTYVVDFVCHESKVVVELDGGHHADQLPADNERTLWLESRSYKVVRFWNDEILKDPSGVLESLQQHLPAQKDDGHEDSH